ncbi:YcjX family protein [Rubripirellula reticaptiva]|uniref:Uncharacterized protein n=1 Tax=Rubripirellula reticaptiva TaxID=2528013 RepID=A0A5C6EDI0_9BACT|nr:YcjX family protein [Rubripirellula reticaptiva]TWU46484.1 hypothetical protein Poly59_54270 [Rubripirellula reticaptiva]
MLNRTHHIGVIGLTQSGKTTFLTSLLDHWNNHHPKKFPLGRTPQKHSLMIQWNGEDEDSGRRLFEQNRASIASGEWVSKSLALETYSLSLNCSSWHLAQPIKLYDIPGERLADAEMLRHKCLSHWSEAIVHTIEVDPSLSDHAADFLRAYRGTTSATESSLSRLEKAYRRLMAKFLRSRIPLITPSSMLVDSDGNYVPDDSMTSIEKLEKWFTEQCPMGISGKPIVPVPKCFKDKKSEMWLRCQSHYNEYRRMVVRPALEPLGACHDIVFLVDIAGIFAQGASWKNQASTLIERFVGGVAPGSWTEKWWKKSLHYGALGLVAPQVDRIVFVATQTDRIHRDDRSKVKQLLEDLARPAVRYPASKGYLEVHYCVAAAVESTESHPMHELRYLNQDESEPSKATISELPDEFPNGWKRGDYRFPRTAPRMPENKGNPPKQFGLDAITEILFAIKK